MAQNKMRERLADEFLHSLEEGKLPWVACWKAGKPSNATNKKEYHGINSLLLAYAAAKEGFTDNRWCTFKQAESKGWKIKKGSKGWPVEYWAYYDKEAHKMLSWADAAKLRREDVDYFSENCSLRSKCYTVFNAAQIDGIEDQEAQDAMNSCESIAVQRDILLANMGLKLVEGGDQPYYSPDEDAIHLPLERDFFDSYAYAGTLLHESAHATGHSSRLNRDLSGSFGSESYAKEELRAEIASAFAAQALGLKLTDEQLAGHINLHKAYVQSWAKAVKDAPNELFKAIKDAEKIADYLIEKGQFDADAGREVA